MRKSRKNSRGGFLGRLFLVLIPVLILVLGFNLIPARFLDVHWPLGIASEEIKAYQEVLTWSKTQPDSVVTNDWRISVESDSEWNSNARTARWNYGQLTTNEGNYQVRIRRVRSTTDALLVKSEKGTYIRGKRQLVLIPATVEHIKEKYLQILAEELELPSPKIQFVSLSFLGSEPKAYLLEERVDNHFADRFIGSDAVAFETCFDTRWPACMQVSLKDKDAQSLIQEKLTLLAQGAMTIEEVLSIQEMSSLLVLLQTGKRSLSSQQNFAFRWMDGKIVPVHRAARPSIHENLLGQASLMFIASQAKLISQNKKLPKIQKEVWRIKERFAKARNQFIPLLAGLNGIPSSVAMAEAEKIGTNILYRFSNVNDSLYQHSAAGIAHGKGASIHKPKANEAEQLTIGQLAIKYKGWLEKDTLVLPRGRYIIEEDLIIPKDKGLKLLSGVRMFIAPGKSILVQGPFSVRASSLRPCFIRPLIADSAWGSIAVNMKQDQTSIINGLYMSGGSQVVIGGHKHSAMLSFHNGNVSFTNSGLSTCYGEDLVNIKHGNVKIEKCSFSNGKLDLLDLDDVTGSVKSCQFKNGNALANGDGLDLSESKVYVEKCTFSNCSDKGISVGERSKVLVNKSIFYQDSIGVAVKDGSVAHVYASSFRENQIALNAYRKKAWMTGAKLNYAACVFYTEGQNILKDSHSSLTELSEMDRKVIFDFEDYGAR